MWLRLSVFFFSTLLTRLTRYTARIEKSFYFLIFKLLFVYCLPSARIFSCTYANITILFTCFVASLRAAANFVFFSFFSETKKRFSLIFIRIVNWKVICTICIFSNCSFWCSFCIFSLFASFRMLRGISNWKSMTASFFNVDTYHINFI